jgi:hypothetical protein
MREKLERASVEGSIGFCVVPRNLLGHSLMPRKFAAYFRQLSYPDAIPVRVGDMPS